MANDTEKNRRKKRKSTYTRRDKERERERDHAYTICIFFVPFDPGLSTSRTEQRMYSCIKQPIMKSFMLLITYRLTFLCASADRYGSLSVFLFLSLAVFLLCFFAIRKLIILVLAIVCYYYCCCFIVDRVFSVCLLHLSSRY